MSEKRFEKVTPFAVNDTWDNHRPIECASSLDADVVCHYLNEQQEIIELLKKEGICLASMFEEQIKENKRLKDELNDCEKFRYQVFKKIGELK